MPLVWKNLKRGGFMKKQRKKMAMKQKIGVFLYTIRYGWPGLVLLALLIGGIVSEVGGA